MEGSDTVYLGVERQVIHTQGDNLPELKRDGFIQGTIVRTTSFRYKETESKKIAKS
jgi:hypothetical protein